MELQFERPPLYRKQFEAVYDPKRYSIIEASTKSGKTIACIIWLIEKAFNGGDGENYWWVAPVGLQADIAFRRAIAAIPREYCNVGYSHKTIHLVNGSTIWFKSADHPDSLYGEDVHAAVIDEASRMKEGSFHAVRSTLTKTRGPIRIIGNVQGKKNWFYMMARRAQNGDPAMGYHRIVAGDAVRAGVLDKDEIEDARRTLPDAAFRELYLAEAVDDRSNPFGPKIRECIKPLSKLRPVVWGWDLAKSEDWTVGIALDDAMQVCRFERWQLPWEVTIPQIARLTGTDSALVDSTGVGDPILERLQKEKHSNYEGFNFSAGSKQKLMEGLSLVIQTGQVAYPEGPIVLELLDFQYEYTRTGVRYCMDASTPVLTADLRWTPVGSLLEGDSLLAFDEEPTGESRVRSWATATVTETGIVKRPCYQVFLADGTAFICSAEHLWLTPNNNGPMLWRKTSDLRGQHAWSKSPRFTPHKLLRVTDSWIADHSYEGGYLAAAFDGEGSLTQISRLDHEGRVSRLSFAQRDNAMAMEVRRCLKFFDFEWSETVGGGTNGDVVNFSIKGRTASLLRFLGQIRPKRLLSQFDPDKLGAMWGSEAVAIEAVEYLGEREVVALGTNKKTFIANGFATHNSAPEGFHDDCVCALALAVWHYQAKKGDRDYASLKWVK